MYRLNMSTKFKKDLKKISKNPKNDILVREILKVLKKNGVSGVDKSMTPHKLKGDYEDNWECHIKPDLLIIWFQIESPNVIKLVRIGSHSDLFR